MNQPSMTDSFRVPDDYAREYLAHAADLKLSTSSTDTYESHLRGYVVFLHDGEISVLDAAFTDVIEFVEECVRRGNRQSTIEGKVATISELYKYIRLRTEVGDELSLEPLRLDDIDVSRYRTPEPIEREALSREELRRLFDAFDSYRNRLMAVVAVETGLRNSDLRELRIADLDFDNLEIHVLNPKGSDPYDVPMSEELSYELDFWLRHHRAGYASADKSPYVFPSQCGLKLETNGSLNQIIRDAADRAGLQEVIGESRISKKQGTATEPEDETRQWHRVTPHTLRHSFITLLADAGVDLSYRQLVANHASAETTRGYTHTADDRFGEIREIFVSPR
ncbi:site-specific integrase [Natrarchaeobius halalkaliphilus]|uniref:Site-specific integrase n=1 Tax=Natrarchaeobius halalkaliphilus TaxID=1679091 RepID=A0A3N6N3V6_9EURY|nr:site-specific integrase [Natrarchaeobius halalkaliphilus]RQG92832.1 site-specific integrase [Natrarchaeobius halalkaliphilus]